MKGYSPADSLFYGPRETVSFIRLMWSQSGMVGCVFTEYTQDFGITSWFEEGMHAEKPWHLRVMIQPLGVAMSVGRQVGGLVGKS